MTRPVQSISFHRQPLDTILSSTGNVRVLRAMIGHGGPITIGRIAAATRMTPEGIRSALAALERTRVVEALGDGRSRLYRAVAEHSLVVALDVLFRAEDARFHEILHAVTVCSSDRRILAVWLFGSVATGLDGVGSDVDLATVIDAGPRETDAVADELRDALREPQHRLGFAASVIALSKADLREHVTNHSPLLADLLRDARALLGPSPEELVASLLVVDAILVE